MANRTALQPAKLDTVEQVQSDMEELARLRRSMDEITTKREHDLSPHAIAIQPHQAKIAEITEEADTALQPLREQYELIEKRVSDSAMVKSRWTRWAGTAKRLDFSTGGYITRHLKKSKRLKYSMTDAKLITALRSAGHPEMVNVVESVKVSILKQRPDVIDKLDGVELVQDHEVKVSPLG